MADTIMKISGSDAPELKEVKVGFIPLTDCASLVVASRMKFDEKYGIKIVLSKEASWSAIRDKVVNGELHAAQMLYGLVYGVHLGIGGPKKDMAVLMTINQNGQGISLASHLKKEGVSDGKSLAKAIKARQNKFKFAHTFPTGTHAMWLYYWLASYGINPISDVETITVPPPQMVMNTRFGNMDGFCVGEPWNARGIYDKISFSVASSQDVWADHPEKVLGATAEFVQKNPNTSRALIMAMLDAAKYIDIPANREMVAEMISAKEYVDAPVDVIKWRFMGEYEDGVGGRWHDPNHMKFFNGGKVPFPYLSDGMWFLTQFRRWGLLKEDPDYLGIARQINQIELYRQAAAQINVAVPGDVMRSSTLLDGKIWDGKNPEKYAGSFEIKAEQATENIISN
ncbi:MAG: nitrate transporter [Gallionellales bacterium 35-53-114]|jgi:nitrate/nitrite transport system substrate-binding protein|nr:MAG: nitrate transporter [Gallionellales bacterium 35-53-114]OYZ62604.1 MAG: nitrate transporter [Gallionellales bacterium 24-53-125]OZB09678.1 MAG: nitrate transporter [Gallionellales bacterium 39-52-133]HQS57765.1 CmpA/NrtA family ABC transporter substrate-binding protein [Gallionellaceae bacterium]HQS74218.1 CmpA/NrtA family ABC transporter substrate-binding protein [Gallionellaceae bacterium]